MNLYLYYIGLLYYPDNIYIYLLNSKLAQVHMDLFLVNGKY